MAGVQVYKIDKISGIQSSIISLGEEQKVFPRKSYKSNSSNKKITRFSGSDNQPIVELSITNLLVFFGKSY
jgi:hypothetical protein